MTTYRVIRGELTGFAVEISFPSGVTEVTAGFPTKEAAAAWLADRMTVASDQREQHGREP
jgi:hypothetical protein